MRAADRRDLGGEAQARLDVGAGGERVGVGAVEDVARAEGVHRTDLRHLDLPVPLPVPPVHGVRSGGHGDGGGAAAAQLCRRLRRGAGARGAEVGGGDHVAHLSHQLVHDRLPSPGIEHDRESCGRCGVTHGAGELGVVTVQQHHVGPCQQLVHEFRTRARGLEPSGVTADHGALPRRLEHRHRGDRRCVAEMRGDVVDLDALRGQFRGDGLRDRALPQRCHQHGVPAEGREGHRGVRGRSAGGDELGGGGDLLVRTGRGVHAVDDIEGGEAGEDAAGSRSGHGITLRPHRPRHSAP